MCNLGIVHHHGAYRIALSSAQIREILPHALYALNIHPEGVTGTLPMVGSYLLPPIGEASTLTLPGRKAIVHV